MRNGIHHVAFSAMLLGSACGTMTSRDEGSRTDYSWDVWGPGAQLLAERYETRGHVTRGPNGVFHVVMPTIRAREYAGVGGTLGECRWPVVIIRDRVGIEESISGDNMICPQKGAAFAGGGTVLVTGEFDFKAEPRTSEWLVSAGWSMDIVDDNFGDSHARFSVAATFFDVVVDG